jgi:hypothetical protein
MERDKEKTIDKDKGRLNYANGRISVTSPFSLRMWLELLCVRIMQTAEF